MTPTAGAGAVEVLDAHTAATVWWRASGHLLEHLLDDGAVVLRQLKDSAAASHRLERVRAVAGAVRLHAVWGAPDVIADRIEDLTGSGAPGRIEEGS